MLSDSISDRTIALLFLNAVEEHYSCCFSTTIPYKILYHHKAFHNWLAPNFNSQFSLLNFHFSILNSHFSILNYPPFYPPKEHNSKKC